MNFTKDEPVPEQLVLSEGLCVALLPQKQRMWTVSHHSFPFLSLLCNGAARAGSGASRGAPLPWDGRERRARGTSTLCETAITPAWPGEDKGTPGVTYSKWWHWPGRTGHHLGELQGTGLIGGEEGSQIHSPRQKSPCKVLKMGLFNNLASQDTAMSCLHWIFPSLINKTGGHRP